MRYITKKRVSTTFYITLFISLVLMAGPIYLSFLWGSSSFLAGVSYVAVYGNIYVLWPLLGISLILLVIQNFKQQGLFKATKEISFHILLILVSALIVYGGIKEMNYQSNQLKIVIANKTDKEVKNIKLHGRNALTEVDSLSANSDTTVIFRGKDINYETENDYENEVTLLYYYDSKWRKQPVLEGAGRWTVFNGPFKLAIHGADSVHFTYLNSKSL